MLKYIYRIIILICVFVASIYYFSRDIKEVVFRIDNTTIMEDTTFPLVTIKSGDENINLLHGYSSNMDANVVRETVTPLGTEQMFEVLIDQKDYIIKKLNYEVREFVGNDLIETGSVSVLEDNGEEIMAKIKLKSELSQGKEYAVKITLITSESEKMYYYHRIKIYIDSYLSEKLTFIMDFHKAIRNKDTAKEVIKYLEPKSNADNSSYSYVNIYSSFDLISWGDLQPTFITKVIPSVIEIYTDTASVELNYFVEAEVSGTVELYSVKEFYRVRYTKDRMYLLNYERSMEAMFDINLVSITKNELKLGITSDYQIPFLSSADQQKLAFVRNRELWFYSLDKNEMTKVFSFRQEETDYLRDIYDQHDIRILNMDAEGNLDFLVYGYMNRGEYEGRVAVVLYHYIRLENRIEELVYIPVEETYQRLKEDLSEFAYINSKDVFYFRIYNNIYSYNLITGETTKVAENIQEDQFVVLSDLNYIAWQVSADPNLSKEIIIMDLETGVTQSMVPPKGYNILLMGMIDSNIIYGFVKEGDIVTLEDGKVLAPLSMLEIASIDKKVLKSYNKMGYYISNLKVNANVIELTRVQKVMENGTTSFISASDDFIMNQIKEERSVINVTSRVTEQALTEAYLTLPTGFHITEPPKLIVTVNTVISEDPTIRLQDAEQAVDLYYPYIMGRIEGVYDNASDAIRIANNDIGVVLNNWQQLIWERGVKSNKHTISRFEEMTWIASENNTVESCIELMLTYQGISINKDRLDIRNSSIYQVLKENSEFPPIRLTGITLDDALYYISDGRPVIAMTDKHNAVLIYGYDAFNIMVINPTKNKVEKMGIQDSAKIFSEAGNVFLSYLE